MSSLSSLCTRLLNLPSSFAPHSSQPRPFLTTLTLSPSPPSLWHALARDWRLEYYAHPTLSRRSHVSLPLTRSHLSRGRTLLTTRTATSPTHNHTHSKQESLTSLHLSSTPSTARLLTRSRSIAPLSHSLHCLPPRHPHPLSPKRRAHDSRSPAPRNIRAPTPSTFLTLDSGPALARAHAALTACYTACTLNKPSPPSPHSPHTARHLCSSHCSTPEKLRPHAANSTTVPPYFKSPFAAHLTRTPPTHSLVLFARPLLLLTASPSNSTTPHGSTWR